jgi:hypothetical protein
MTENIRLIYLNNFFVTNLRPEITPLFLTASGITLKPTPQSGAL